MRDLPDIFSLGYFHTWTILLFEWCKMVYGLDLPFPNFILFYFTLFCFYINSVNTELTIGSGVYSIVIQQFIQHLLLLTSVLPSLLTYLTCPPPTSLPFSNFKEVGQLFKHELIMFSLLWNVCWCLTLFELLCVCCYLYVTCVAKLYLVYLLF